MGSSSKRTRPKGGDVAVRPEERDAVRAENRQTRIRPAAKNVGESAGNLRQRAAWFRKRASGAD